MSKKRSDSDSTSASPRKEAPKDPIRIRSKDSDDGQGQGSSKLGDIRLSELRAEKRPASNGANRPTSKDQPDNKDGMASDDSTTIRRTRELLNDSEFVATSGSSEDDVESFPSTASGDGPNRSRELHDSESDRKSEKETGPSENVEDQDESPTVISERGVEVDGSIPPMTTRELGRALVGTRLQNYELAEFVGGGGMGAVFRANDLKLGRTVAIKVLARTGPNGELAKRFINEAQSAARLDHENIARVYNVDESAGLSYIVFEFVEGVNLREAVAANGPMSVEQVIRYTLQIADALDHASQRNVIHRDIKPSNILIASNGKIKLVDMGLARMVRLDATDPDLTASGMTLGTFDYISPEQAKDPRQADVRSDLYSLGCTMFFMLTGKPPFPDGTPFEKLLHHRERRRPDLRRIRNDLPPEMAQLVRKLMAASPNHRFQSAGELIAALSWNARRVGLTMSTTPGIERALATYMNRRSWVQSILPIAVPAALLFVAVVVVELLADRSATATQVVTPSYASETMQVDPSESVNQVNDENIESVDDSGNNNSLGGNGQSGDASIDGTGDQGEDLVVGNGNQGESLSGSDDDNGNETIEPGGAGGGTASNSGDTVGSTSDDTESGNSTQTMDPSRIKYLVVGEPSLAQGSDWMAVETLRDAFVEANQFPNLVSIRLRFNGERALTPFSIDEGDWLVEADEGFRPVFVVSRPANSIEPDSFDLTCLSLQWKGIDFVWNASSGVSFDDRALFRIAQNEDLVGAEQALTFRDCTITARFMEDIETLVAPELAMIQITPPATAEFQLNNARVLAEPPAIHFEGCAIRGPMTLVSTPQATPYLLVWNQGLFISNKRLIDSRGVENAALGFRIRILLRNVTIAADRGLARVVTSEERQEFVPLRVTATNSIFETEKPSPLVEHIGTSAADLSKMLIMDGVNNYFPDSSPIWIVRTELDPAPSMIVEFEDAIQDDRWFLERLYERGSTIRWEQEPEARSSDVSRRGLGDYQLREEATNPAYQQMVGFDPLEIRPFPKTASTPAIEDDRPAVPFSFPLFSPRDASDRGFFPNPEPSDESSGNRDNGFDRD